MWVLFLAIIGAAYATEIPFEEAVRLLLQDHPETVSLRAQEESARYKAMQQLSPNNPVFTVQRNDVIGYSPFGNAASQQLNLTWTLGFPGKSLAPRAVNRGTPAP